VKKTVSPDYHPATSVSPNPSPKPAHEKFEEMKWCVRKMWIPKVKSQTGARVDLLAWGRGWVGRVGGEMGGFYFRKATKANDLYLRRHSYTLGEELYARKDQDELFSISNTLYPAIMLYPFLSQDTPGTSFPIVASHTLVAFLFF
jgi:hypothetical protein